ncbi:DUF5018 domain-containing protein [Flavobacterium zhairuonense]|uniref:DUF5018 domain-containing protein n=1 Tax=Flavobacterium zhairuonense TaxID=2493631 RepID=UPI0010507785|nr:DUF5018 domain-containing protein [Flavobacterium zhairuonense]KAF2512085.1 DUF5018 domain-containing protein [Flavobacterium zhairuonense]
MKNKINLFGIFLFIAVLMTSCVSEVTLSSDNKIQSFSITRENVAKDFVIGEKSIVGSVESTFELENINLTIAIPKGAKISPDPATIKSITGPLAFVVTAENGEIKNYDVDIKRELSTDNFILEANVKTPNLVLSGDIAKETGLVTKRIPESNDLKNLIVEIKFSKHATITPDPNTIKDYSAPVNFTVKSESGVEKVYQVKLQLMDSYISRSCSEANAWKWFGGDNRNNAPDIVAFDRNVGTGQTVIVNKNLVPSTFRIHLREGFSYDNEKQAYNKPVTLKLIVRDASLNVLATTTTDISAQFNGGFIPFDLQKLNLFLEANKTYNFYWYLVDGEKLGVTASSSGNTNSGTGFCFNSGYSGESKISKKNTLDDANVWTKHEWHFNIELEGKE